MLTSNVLALEPHDRAVMAAVCCRDLDHDTTLRLQSELASALDAATNAPLILDLSRVEFVPSLALGMMVKVHKALTQAGRKCVLVGVQPLVLDSLRATALDRFLVVCGTAEEALQLI